MKKDTKIAALILENNLLREKSHQGPYYIEPTSKKALDEAFGINAKKETNQMAMYLHKANEKQK